MRRELFAERHAALARQRTRRQRLHAGARELLLFEHAAGAPRDRLGAGIRPAQQRCGDRRLVRVEPARVLAEQRLGKRADADDLAAKRHGVQVGLEDLALLPACVEACSRQRLADLLRHAAAAGRAREAVVEQAGELHRQRRCAAGLAVPEVAPGAGRDRIPVDAAVFVEAPVFAEHDRLQQRRRHVGQRHPRQPPHLAVDPQRLQGHAVAVEQHEIGRAVRGPHLGEARQRVRRARGAGRAQQRGRRRGTPACHGATATTAFGASPKVSGAYIASTRVGGNANRPGLLRRTVYSITCLPFGRYSK